MMFLRIVHLDTFAKGHLAALNRRERLPLAILNGPLL
jgi:hypothetical protein